MEQYEATVDRARRAINLVSMLHDMATYGDLAIEYRRGIWTVRWGKLKRSFGAQSLTLTHALVECVHEASSASTSPLPAFRGLEADVGRPLL